MDIYQAFVLIKVLLDTHQIFKPPSPDVQRGNRTVFLSGVKSSIEDQTGNTTVYNTCVSLCTSTCLPEIKVCHTVLGGNSGVLNLIVHSVQ